MWVSIVVPSEQFMRDSGPADFERVLETLIVLAHSQGRNFLAYLLIMAQARGGSGRTKATH
jgi:hypothetical protein